jgi:hypothetical protein
MQIGGSLNIWHDRIVAALYPAELVFVLPNGVAEGITEYLGCKIVHADVDRPLVCIPAR